MSDAVTPRPALPRRIVTALTRRWQVIAALGIRALALIASFGVTWWISHTLGAAANGRYALVSQTAIFLSVVGLIGLDVAVVRHFSATAAKRMPLDRAAFLHVSGLGIGLMIVVGVLLLIARGPIADWVFGGAVSPEMLLIAGIMIVGRGGARLFGAILRSQRSYTLGQSVDVLVVPAVVLVLMITHVVSSLESILWATAIVSVVTLMIGLIANWRYTARGPDTVAPGMRAVLHSALPLWGAGVSANIGDWYGLVIAANMLGAHEAGLYRVAAQAAMVLQVVSLALFNVYTPKISASFHARDLAWTGRLTRAATRWSALCSLPLALLLIIFAERLLALFGPEFVTAAPVLRILVIGQLFFTLKGPGGLTMAMSGNERVNLVITLVSTGLLFVTVPIATWFGGLVGLAICISVVMIARNLASMIWLDRKIGLNVVTGRVRDMSGDKTGGDKAP